ncbi:hypothetical protein RBSWK_00864 [Rhodopirellula baltica SWK14]|uniref:Uncharacterized protein n=1 Tax=Rhodopirellula baltica SWK14 TaxID=993516 RepID=L7CQ47_RHOBT|nr:hypothetical protein RBSWK_00864 [Rhodopirellula baltica SWK14]
MITPIGIERTFMKRKHTGASVFLYLIPVPDLIDRSIATMTKPRMTLGHAF